ncbi:MAG: glycosyltransferase, partial [Miltoncostaeaceae bacterium]
MSGTLSIVIPVLNEAETLPRILDAVDARDEVHEIIVVDDGSTDDSAHIASSFPSRHPLRVIS